MNENKKMLTPRQVMYRLEKFEENENKLKEYKQSIKKEMNRLRQIETRYKKHVLDHAKNRAKGIKDFDVESFSSHHRKEYVLDIPKFINKEYILVYNGLNSNQENIINNININLVRFKVDNLSSDDLLKEKIIMLDDGSELLEEFAMTNENNIIVVDAKSIKSLNDINDLRIKIERLVL